MLVFDESNNYRFPNAVINFQDNTYWDTESELVTAPIPKFTILLPIYSERGRVNRMMLYKNSPTYAQMLTTEFGAPNMVKYGVNLDLANEIINRGDTESIGVWICNVRDISARAANIILSMKYRIEQGVEVTDASGNPLYLDPNGDVTISPTTTIQTTDGVITTDNERLTRDVLHVKYVTDYDIDVSKWSQSNDVMAKLYNTKTVDSEGYYTIPMFMIVHTATSTYGNNVYFRMIPTISYADNKMYYALEMFDGNSIVKTNADYSFNENGSTAYAENAFIEEAFNDKFGGLMRLTASVYLNEALELINNHIALDDITYDNIDIFDPTINGEPISTGYVIDIGSIDATASKAFKLQGGSNGDPEKDNIDYLFEQFFLGNIITDLKSVICWKINYIPDTGYNDATVEAIKQLCSDRNRTTICTILLAGDTFDGAIASHNIHHSENMPLMRQLCSVQKAMNYNTYIKRTVFYPPTYFDTLELVDRVLINGHPYMGFAGYNCRWDGFIEDTMTYPPEDAELMNRLDNARITVLMKDSEPGGYLSDQKMNTRLISDQTEFNNAMLISDMLYDIIDMIHRNSFNYNEDSDVNNMKSLITSSINTTYAPHAANINLDVYRAGTRGKDKYTTKIVIQINLKDINKYAVVDFILTDE